MIRPSTCRRTAGTTTRPAPPSAWPAGTSSTTTSTSSRIYETGIASINPTVITPPYQDNPANGPIYPSYVPRTDEDGNDIAGVRLVDVTMPLATYTGWALRSGPQANDGCEGSGQMIPFARTQAERLAKGDPRLSIEERYPSYEFYARRVVYAIKQMVQQRLMLCEDADHEVERAIAAGLAAGVPESAGYYTPPRICAPPRP